MDKFMDINLTESMRKIMDSNTVFYKSDFDIDVDFLRKTARLSDDSEKNLLWFSRPSGTFCDTDRQVFQSDTSGHNGWRYHAEQTHDRVLAYAVEVDRIDMKTGDVFGNLYELDYHKHAECVRNEAVPSSEVTVFFKNGDKEVMDRDDFNHVNFLDIPPVRYHRNEPDSPNKLLHILSQAKNDREQSCVLGNLEEHIRRLQDGRITFEADRIMDKLQTLKEPNSPNKSHFMVEIDYHFVQFASNDEIDKLQQAIPYMSLSLSSIKEKHGMYAFVSRDEIADERKGQEFQSGKPSVLETLKINAEKSKRQISTPKKDTQKSNGMEM